MRNLIQDNVLCPSISERVKCVNNLLFLKDLRAFTKSSYGIWSCSWAAYKLLKHRPVSAWVKLTQFFFDRLIKSPIANNYPSKREQNSVTCSMHEILKNKILGHTSNGRCPKLWINVSSSQMDFFLPLWYDTFCWTICLQFNHCVAEKKLWIGFVFDKCCE